MTILHSKHAFESHSMEETLESRNQKSELVVQTTNKQTSVFFVSIQLSCKVQRIQQERKYHIYYSKKTCMYYEIFSLIQTPLSPNLQKP